MKTPKPSSKQTPYKLWGGRFDSGPSELLETFSRSIQFDYRLAQADIRGTKAYAGALERAKILTRAERVRAQAALDKVAKEVSTIGPEFFANSNEEDIHSFILGKLRERIGRLADKLHTGRSRNEQVALDFRMWIKTDAIVPAQRALKQLVLALVTSGEQNAKVVLPGYTHLRRAQPVLWPHYLLAYVEMFRRDYDRLARCLEAADVMPLASGALAGSGLSPENPVDRLRLAKELGFSRISRNSMDIVSDRDFAMEFLFTASMCMLHLSRLAEDFILYSSEEFAFLEIGDAVSTGSSLMPQKKNPDSLELIRGKSGRVIGHLVSLATTLKGLPLTYNRDLQEDKEPVFGAAEQLIPSVLLASQVVSTTALNPAAMKKAGTDGWLCATDLAEDLATRGVPFHDAHKIVGKLVLESLREGKQPQDADLAHLRRFSSLFDQKSLSLLTPEVGVSRRTVAGGTAPSSVRQALKEAREWLRSIPN